MAIMKQYVVTLLNNKDYIVESDLDSTKKILEFMTKNDFDLERDKLPPVSVKRGIAIMVMERNDGAKSPMDRIWRIV